VRTMSVPTIAGLRSRAIQAGWGDNKRHDLEPTIDVYVRIAVEDEAAGVWASLNAECVQQGAGCRFRLSDGDERAALRVGGWLLGRG